MTVTIKNSYGGGFGTEIITDEDADICGILGVESIEIPKFSGNDFIKVIVTLGFAKIDIRPDKVAWVIKNPLSNQFESVSSILFSNRTSISFDDTGGVTLYDSNAEIVEIISLSDGRTHKFKRAKDDDHT
jgi:hypothetical protein